MTNRLFTVARRTDKPVENRIAEFVLSTSVEDRAGDIIDQSGWHLDNYLKNPVVLWGHDQRIPPIGRCLNPRVVNGALVSSVEFATAEQHPLAETIYQLVKGGYVNAGSVGFMPIKWNYNEDRRALDFAEQELLEYSMVGVPMNPEALAQARSAGIDADKIEKAFGELSPMLPAMLKSATYRDELIAGAATAAAVSQTKSLERRKRRVALNLSTLNGH